MNSKINNKNEIIQIVFFLTRTTKSCNLTSCLVEVFKLPEDHISVSNTESKWQPLKSCPLKIGKIALVCAWICVLTLWPPPCQNPEPCHVHDDPPTTVISTSSTFPTMLPGWNSVCRGNTQCVCISWAARSQTGCCHTESIPAELDLLWLAPSVSGHGSP